MRWLKVITKWLTCNDMSCCISNLISSKLMLRFIINMLMYVKWCERQVERDASSEMKYNELR